MTAIDDLPAARPVTPLGILVETLDRIRAVIDPADDPALADDVRAACVLAGGLDPYLEACTTPESDDLRRLAERTRTEDWGRRQGGVFLEQEMLSGHVEGQMLKFLVHATRARRVLEVGLFTGYSALAMAEALDEGGADGGADGEVVACELDADVAAFAQESFDSSRAGSRIRVEVGPAADTLRTLAAAGETFDLVFVDADKAGYVDYLSTLLDTGLLAPHGVVCVDNTLMQGQPYGVGEPTANGEAIAAFNRAVADDPRVAQVVLPLRDGLTLVRRTETP